VAPEIVALQAEPESPPMMTPVTWRRSSRARRVTLRIDPSSAGLIITLPTRTPVETGLELLRTHHRWIVTRINALPVAPDLRDGQTIPVDGQSLLIRHCPDARRGVWIEDGAICVSGDAAFLARRLREFLMREAKLRLAQHISTIAQTSGLRPSGLVLRDTRSRWGSCSESGQIMLCWRLVMAPPWVQHYVAAHEIAHLRHFDHSPAFWRLVATLCTTRREAEAWLRKNGPLLMRIG